MVIGVVCSCVVLCAYPMRTECGQACAGQDLQSFLFVKRARTKDSFFPQRSLFKVPSRPSPAQRACAPPRSGKPSLRLSHDGPNGHIRLPARMMPTAPDAVYHALEQHSAHLAAGDTKAAAAILSAAQRMSPSSPELACRQLDACLQSNQLVCAAHAVRALLRHASADHPELCTFLSSARAFGASAAALRWCPPGEPCTRAVTNSTPDEGVVAASGASLDDGQLWRAENFISGLKALLADESLWQVPYSLP